MSRASRWAAYVVFPLAAGCGGEGSGEGSATLEGLVQKGPMVAGSEVQAELLDAGGGASGEVMTARTTADDGHFLLEVEHDGPIAVMTRGTYFHETRGETSATPVELRALLSMNSHGFVAASVNVLSHLAEPRARARLDELGAVEAIAAAEAEVVATLGVGVPDLAIDRSSAELDVVDGPTLADAYGAALSAVVLEAAELRAATDQTGPEVVGELLDDLASDLSDGELDADHADLLHAAETRVLTTRTEQLLGTIAEAGVVDLDRVIDTDHDGVRNADDTCPWVPNPEQQPVLDEVCHAYAEPLSAGEALDGARSIALAHLDDDDRHDAVVFGTDGELAVLMGDGKGQLSPASQSPLSCESVQLVDLTGDGSAELIAVGIDVVEVFELDGATLLDGITSEIPTQGGGGFAVGDLTGDQLPELMAVASFGVEGDFELPLSIGVNQGDGRFVDAHVQGTLEPVTSLAGPLATAVYDANDDGHGDAVVVALSEAGDEAVVLVYPGDGTATLGSPVTSRHVLPPTADPEFIGEAVLHDVTGDGRPDVSLMGRLNLAVVLPGQAGGTFGVPLTSDVGLDLTHGRVVATGDFTGDGLPDLASVVDPDLVGELHLVILPGRGDGTYGAVTTRVSRLLGLAAGVRVAAAADLDRDGADDLVLGLATGSPAAAVMPFAP